MANTNLLEVSHVRRSFPRSQLKPSSEALDAEDEPDDAVEYRDVHSKVFL